jgi:site-specific DNA-cytosine methylase
MRTLIVNTYAGSLLLGADDIPGANIIGSYEDSGFGSANTKANVGRFKNLLPSFHFIDHIKKWPDQDLTDTIILAHPPCAAFSQQNTSAAKRGINTDAFECTRKVLKYGMTNNAAAIAIESVPGALGGAWDVHEHMAEQGGYHVYRVMKNSWLFGVPQYRERFWCVFVRQGLANPTMTWRLSPVVRTVGAVLNPIEVNTPIAGHRNTVDKFIRKLTTDTCICGTAHGFDEQEIRSIGLRHLTGHKRQGFAALIQPKFFPTEDFRQVCRLHVSPFTSAQPSVLAEGGFTPVLLGSSLWVYKSEVVSQEGYKAIMGFPTDYVFPPDKHYGLKTFLSKGVCPPVATWVLDNLRQHLGEAAGSPLTRDDAYVKMVEPGHIVSFRPGRMAILAKLEAMARIGVLEDTDPVELRNEEDALESD